MSPEERRRIEERMAALPEPDLTDPDNPEWTEETFARARAQEHLLPPEVLAFAPHVAARVRGLQRTPTKAQVTLRLDRAVLDHFRATGPGWQSRINTALQEVVRKG